MDQATGMCIVNPDVVPVLAPFAGGQTTIMRCLGISWNTWIKIAAGQLVRMSVGLRLRDRVLSNPDMMRALCARYPVAGSSADIDLAALGHAFLRSASLGKVRPVDRLRGVPKPLANMAPVIAG
ncbi:hypothetical protein PX699_20575 [Sphingobium sp. H39-3-25]|nr:hypothetical protein [Sphingobium arseniciresistens]